MADTTGRIVRVCDLCGDVDVWPRHVVVGAPGDFTITDDVLTRVLEQAPDEQRARLVRELLDTSASDRHIDCCAVAGCPDGSCQQVMAASGGLSGEELLDWLIDQQQRGEG